MESAGAELLWGLRGVLGGGGGVSDRRRFGLEAAPEAEAPGSCSFRLLSLSTAASSRRRERVSAKRSCHSPRGSICSAGRCGGACSAAYTQVNAGRAASELQPRVCECLQ